MLLPCPKRLGQGFYPLSEGTPTEQYFDGYNLIVNQKHH